MTSDNELPSGTGLDETKIVVNSLYLCVNFLLEYVERNNGEDAANNARHELIENLKSGNIDMAIFEDRKLFEFVVSIVEKTTPHK